jgi:hypothetical protein
LLQSNATLLVPGAGDQVCVSAAFADLGGARCGRVCSLAVAGGKLLFHDRQQQIAPLGGFVRLAVQQPLGTGEPPGRAPRLSAKEKTQTNPERAADSTHAFASVQTYLMCALERGQIVFVATDQIRRQGQELEILTDEGRGPIGAQERIVGVRPLSLRIALPTSLKFPAHGCDVWISSIYSGHDSRSPASRPDPSRLL